LKPADSGGQRGVFRLDSIDDLEAHLHTALAESPTEETIIESYHEGIELNGLAIARGGRVSPLTLSDRLRPPGIGFAVGWTHVHPPMLPDEHVHRAREVAAAAVRAMGMRDGIGFPQLLVTPAGEVVVVEVAARIPGGQMADLARHATGVDLVEVALRQALGDPVDEPLAQARPPQPLAIRFLTAAPGPLPVGTVRAVRGLDRVAGAPGVVQAELFFGPGARLRPVQADSDRVGYVIALGDTGPDALARAEHAAGLLQVETTT
jgi:biotin carboxylase